MRRLALLSLPLLSVSALAAEVIRVENGPRVAENIPAIPRELSERLQRYQNTRAATLGGWVADGSAILIGTRFGNTVQAHRVKMPGGAREQLTFFDEPVRDITPNPKRNGFVYGNDVGGSENWQLFWFDLATRETRLLTDGKSRNEQPLWSHDGTKLAFTSTARNGTDADIWVLDLDSGEKKSVLTEGGTWYASDFSPDGGQIVAAQYVSANVTHPVVVNLSDSTLRRLEEPNQAPAYYGAFRYAADKKGAYYVSDESGEFRALHFHDFATNKDTSLTAATPWDVDEFKLSPDRRRLAYITNEDGYGVLHALDTDANREIALPTLPQGVISSPQFSPDGGKLAFALNSAASPSDIYVIDFTKNHVERWTESEVGGLDTARFVMPTLVRFPTFDKAGGKPRKIPAFYYRPRGDGKFPVVIAIHGGPESQSRPTFSADAQFLAEELGVALLVPNVRGSSGYGKSYLKLDNGVKREDSVRDIGALLDWIAKQPDLDASRVGVYGGSYGGYMVLASMTHYSGRLRAGVDVVGISNFVTFLEHTESYRRDLRRVEYGDERDPKLRSVLEKISPTANAERIGVPLFVAQGANDPRVPASEAEQIVRNVRDNGGTVWYLLQRDEGHGFQKKVNKDYFGAATMLFWQQFLRGE